MSYLGLETVKPTKPIKRGDLHIFPKTTADQIITDETTDKRLTTDLAEKMPKSGGTFTGAVTLKGDPTSNLHAATKQYVDNKTGTDLLWTNARPTSAFAAQTISLDLSGYKQVLIMLQSLADTDGWVTGCSLIDVGKTGAMITGLWQQTCGRHATVTTTGIIFTVAWHSGGDEDNKMCVPYKIYGIK